MIRIAFRFDDPSPISKRGVEIGVFREFLKRGLPITFAVIPGRNREGKEVLFSRKTASHLLDGMQERLVEIALHGFRHQGFSIENGSARTEFQGLPLREQEKLIEQGLEETRYIFGNSISGFVPPFNTYDRNTLRAARANGLSYISAGRERPPDLTLPVIPGTCSLGKVLDDVEEARRFIFLKPIIIVVIHHYDFARDPDDPPKPQWSCESLGTLLDWMTNEKELEVVTLNDLALDLTPKGVCFPSYLQLPDLLKWRLNKWIPRYCVTTEPMTLSNVTSLLKKI